MQRFRSHTIVLTDQNVLPTLELRLANRPGEVDEQMCAPVEEIGEEARRATPMYVPRGPSDAERRAHEVHHMSDDGIQVVQMVYAFLHNTGDKDAEVTCFTLVDNNSRSMVATTVQTKGHGMWVERFLLKGLESFWMTGEMVLQTDRETGPIDVAKHVAAERKSTTIIRQTPRKAANQTRTLSEHTRVSKPRSEP